MCGGQPASTPHSCPGCLRPAAAVLQCVPPPPPSAALTLICFMLRDLLQKMRRFTSGTALNTSSAQMRLRSDSGPGMRPHAWTHHHQQQQQMQQGQAGVERCVRLLMGHQQLVVLVCVYVGGGIHGGVELELVAGMLCVQLLSEWCWRLCCCCCCCSC